MSSASTALRKVNLDMSWPKGKSRSEETKRKISEWNISNNRMRGRHHSEEAKRKMSVAASKHLIGNKNRLGIPHSEDIKRRISQTLKSKVSLLRQRRIDWWANIPAEQRRALARTSTDAMAASWRKLTHEERLARTAKGRLACKSPDILKRRSLAISGEKNPMFGKHPSEETRKKQGRPGELNPRWKGGLSRFPYPIAFNDSLKEAIRSHDKYLCQICGEPQSQLGRKLDIHHIDHNKANLSDTNLVALCRPCNSRVNSNPRYWQELLVTRKLLEEA